MYQEDLETRKGHTSPNNANKFLFRQPFQPKHVETCHIRTMANQETKHGEQSRDQGQWVKVKSYVGMCRIMVCQKVAI